MEMIDLARALEVLKKAKLNIEEHQAVSTITTQLESLIRVSKEVAFDKMNGDTELLLRRLLAMGEIEISGGEYKRKSFDFEENFTIDGIEYTREKMFFIDEDRVDDYTKQLEEKVQKLESEVRNLKQELETEQILRIVEGNDE